jgi:hypothetical protein
VSQVRLASLPESLAPGALSFCAGRGRRPGVRRGGLTATSLGWMIILAGFWRRAVSCGCFPGWEGCVRHCRPIEWLPSRPSARRTKADRDMARPPPSPPAAPRSQVVVQLTSQRVDLRDQRLTPGAGSCTTTPRSSAMGSDRHSVTQGRLAGLRETPAPEGLWSRALGGRDAALTAGRQLQPVPSAVSGAFRELIVALLLVLRLQTSLSTAGSQRWPLAGSAQRPAIYKFGWRVEVGGGQGRGRGGRLQH